MDLVHSTSQLLVVGERGIGKRTDLKDYRAQTRGGKGIITMACNEKTGRIVDAVVVAPDDRLMIMVSGAASDEPANQATASSAAETSARSTNRKRRERGITGPFARMRPEAKTAARNTGRVHRPRGGFLPAPSASMEWAFLRGAAKQYGALTWNCISVFNRWGYKSYTGTGDDHGPDKGTSVELMKRLWYVTWLYGSAANGFEGAYTRNGKNGSGHPLLSPVGQTHVDAVRFARRHADRGVLYTPVAIMQWLCCLRKILPD